MTFKVSSSGGTTSVFVDLEKSNNKANTLLRRLERVFDVFGNRKPVQPEDSLSAPTTQKMDLSNENVIKSTSQERLNQQNQSQSLQSISPPIQEVEVLNKIPISQRYQKILLDSQTIFSKLDLSLRQYESDKGKYFEIAEEAALFLKDAGESFLEISSLRGIEDIDLLLIESIQFIFSSENYVSFYQILSEAPFRLTQREFKSYEEEERSALRAEMKLSNRRGLRINITQLLKKELDRFFLQSDRMALKSKDEILMESICLGRTPWPICPPHVPSMLVAFQRFQHNTQNLIFFMKYFFVTMLSNDLGRIKNAGHCSKAHIKLEEANYSKCRKSDVLTLALQEEIEEWKQSTGIFQILQDFVSLLQTVSQELIDESLLNELLPQLVDELLKEEALNVKSNELDSVVAKLGLAILR